MVNEQGLSQEDTGRRLSIPSGTIANWVAAAKSKAGLSRPGDPSMAELTEENRRLRKELNEARMEREIQKKQPRTSPRNRCPVRVHESAATAVPGEADSAGAGGISQRVLCVAHTRAVGEV